VAHIEPPCPNRGVKITGRCGCADGIHVAASDEMVSMSAQAAPILLIEDDLSLQESLRNFFEEGGYETLVAGSRQAGQELIRNHARKGVAGASAICLLDLNLPDGSGLDLLRQIVNERLGIKVIVMSAFPIQHLRGRYPESVLVAMMTKPVSPQHLMEVVEKIHKNGASVA
jgi:DNA-binding response OmpR family regulator